MKKINTIFFLLLSSSMIAQPILNAADINFNGTGNFYEANPVGFTTGLSGANQTWDYSSIPLSLNGTIASNQVLTMPFSSSFPMANYFVKSTYLGTDYYYAYNSSDSKLEVLGIATNSSILVNFSPNPQTVFVFPLTYNLIINDTYSTTNNPTENDPFSIEYDAYGTLITPFETYTNVIRTKKFDGIFPVYSWYLQNSNKILLSVFFGSGGIDLVNFYQYSNLTVSKNDINNQIGIYPNPVNETITVSNSKNAVASFKYKILDVTGRIIKNGTSKYNIKINIEELNKGNYIIQIIENEGNILNKHFLKR